VTSARCWAAGRAAHATAGPGNAGPRGEARERGLGGSSESCAAGRAGPFFVFLFIFFSSSFIYFYSNLDIAFESKIQMYYMSLNGCTTTTVQCTIKCLGMLCNNQGLF
jgi:hypothetical protein